MATLYNGSACTLPISSTMSAVVLRVDNCMSTLDRACSDSVGLHYLLSTAVE